MELVRNRYQSNIASVTIRSTFPSNTNLPFDLNFLIPVLLLDFTTLCIDDEFLNRF